MPFFVASFPYSNVRLAQVFPGENAECVCQSIRNVFEFVGVPTRVVFDNATRVGRRVCDRVRTTKLFGPAAPTTGSVPVLQPLSDTRRKSVENKVGTQRRNLFVPVPWCGTSTGTTRDCWERSRDMSRKEHLQEGRPELELFEDDLAAMLALPGSPVRVRQYTGGRAPTRRARSASTAGTGTRRRPSAPGGRWSSGSGRRGSR